MDNTLPIKATLRPQQIKKVKKFAKEHTKDNFSMALRMIIEDYDEILSLIKEAKPNSDVTTLIRKILEIRGGGISY